MSEEIVFMAGDTFCHIRDSRRELEPLSMHDNLITLRFVEMGVVDDSRYIPPCEVVILGRNNILKISDKLRDFVEKMDIALNKKVNEMVKRRIPDPYEHCKRNEG